MLAWYDAPQGVEVKPLGFYFGVEASGHKLLLRLRGLGLRARDLRHSVSLKGVSP